MYYFVAGLGRCGTSLLMQMLDAGGAPVYPVSPPSYEVTDMKFYRTLVNHGDAIQGKFLKILDPHRLPLPIGEAKVIWCQRDYTEQTKSQIKLIMHTNSASITGKREAIRAIAKGMPADTALCWSKFHRLKYKVFIVNFESMVTIPAYVIEQITTFLKDDFTLDAARMEKCVIMRDPKCRPDLAFESNLISKYEIERQIASAKA